MSVRHLSLPRSSRWSSCRPLAIEIGEAGHPSVEDLGIFHGCKLGGRSQIGRGMAVEDGPDHPGPDEAQQEGQKVRRVRALARKKRPTR